MLKEYTIIGKLNLKLIDRYKNKVITDEVILTHERLNKHILIYHPKDYKELKRYIKIIIEKPDYIIEDTTNTDTLILLKNIVTINKKARIVIKLATQLNNKPYTKNSIITLMRQREKSYLQTLKNKGRIIYAKN
ncbi:MAG: hypothetical protein FWC53_02570 [Firmicutes bacterium]|nr:hypothetical protein [Bacillota bacterium]